MKKKISKETVGFIIFLICIISFTYLCVKYIAQRAVVSGPSMEPAYQNGNNLIIDKFFYRFNGLKRHDIIVFRDENGKILIKRIIALPKETVRIDNEGNIYINDEILQEEYGTEVILDAGIAIQKIQLDEKEYFVLGDNRNNSRDSRVFGPIKEEQIIGKVVLKLPR